MILRYGIDTSVLVRLLTGQPRDRFAHTVRHLTALAGDGTTVVASNQVIGEGLLRLSLGIEACEDLEADLKRALSRAAAVVGATDEATARRRAAHGARR